MNIENKKQLTSAWFRELRDKICQAEIPKQFININSNTLIYVSLFKILWARVADNQILLLL